MYAGQMLGVVDLSHVECRGLQYPHRKYMLLHLLADVLRFAETGFGFERGTSFDEFFYDITAGYLGTSPHCTNIFFVQSTKKLHT
jgi:hypothetical protein